MSGLSLSNDHLLDERQVEAVSGGSAYEDGKTAGGAIGVLYWGARDYLSGTVYQYLLD